MFRPSRTRKPASPASLSRAHAARSRTGGRTTAAARLPSATTVAARADPRARTEEASQVPVGPRPPPSTAETPDRQFRRTPLSGALWGGYLGLVELDNPAPPSPLQCISARIWSVPSGPRRGPGRAPDPAGRVPGLARPAARVTGRIPDGRAPRGGVRRRPRRPRRRAAAGVQPRLKVVNLPPMPDTSTRWVLGTLGGLAALILTGGTLILQQGAATNARLNDLRRKRA